MAHSNYEALAVNFFEPCAIIIAKEEEGKVHLDFLASSWYKDIVHVLQNLQAPTELRKERVLHSKKPPSSGKKSKQAEVLKYYFLYGKLGQCDLSVVD